MIISLNLHLEKIFGNQIPLREDEYRDNEFLLNDADRFYFENEDDFAFLEEFDGRNIVLTHLELETTKMIEIPMDILVKDLHGFFLLSGDHKIELRHSESSFNSYIDVFTAKYFNLPPQRYILFLNPGHYRLFCYYFDGGLFRKKDEVEFEYLHDIVLDYRSNSSFPTESNAINLDNEIVNQIRRIFKNLKKGSLSCDIQLMQSVNHLMNLLNNKSNNDILNEVFEGYYAKKAEKFIISSIANNSYKELSFYKLANDLGISFTYLNDEFKKMHNNKTLLQYRDHLLIEKIKEHLEMGTGIKEIANIFDFSSVPYLSTFFKKRTNLTLDQYRQQLNGSE